MGTILNKMTQIFNSRAAYVRSFVSGDDIPKPDYIDVEGKEALKHPVVWACCRVRAEALASLSIHEYRQSKDGHDRQATDDTGILPLLKSAPNDFMSAFTFATTGQYHMDLGGNFVSERIFDRYGDTVGLMPLYWERLTIELDPKRRVPIYKYLDENKKEKIYQREQVVHILGPSLDGINGLSPIAWAAEEIRLGLMYSQYSKKLFQNGAFPSGTLESPGVIPDELRPQFVTDFRKNYFGMVNHGVPMILEGGLKYNPLTMNPVDAQVLACSQAQDIKICQYYRVPPHMVQDLQRSTNNNIEHQGLEFATYTMLPITKQWESAINRQLLTEEQRKKRYYFEFNMASLLRGDLQAQANFFQTGRMMGYLSVNDIRRLLNLNKIPNGDIYLQPVNMVEAGTEPTDEVKKEVDGLMKEKEESK